MFCRSVGRLLFIRSWLASASRAVPLHLHIIVYTLTHSRTPARTHVAKQPSSVFFLLLSAVHGTARNKQLLFRFLSSLDAAAAAVDDVNTQPPPSLSSSSSWCSHYCIICSFLHSRVNGNLCISIVTAIGSCDSSFIICGRPKCPLQFRFHLLLFLWIYCCCCWRLRKNGGVRRSIFPPPPLPHGVVVCFKWIFTFHFRFFDRFLLSIWFASIRVNEFVIESFVFNICVLFFHAHASQVAAKGASSSATTATACPVRKSATESPTAPEAKTNSIAVSLSLLSFCYSIRH